MIRLGFQLYTKCLVSRGLEMCRVNDMPLKNRISPTAQFVRNTSFFNKISADALWKGVTSVSNAGKKRGRGKGTDRKGKKNFNIGQKIGHGTNRILWPGLTSPVLQSNTVLKVQKLPKAEETKVEEPKVVKRLAPIHPLERGWSGRKIEGKFVPLPKADREGTYENFETVVIESRLISVMTKQFGRKRRFTTLALAGNRNGLIGMALGKALEGKISIQRARMKAAKHLISFDFIDKHTVNHDFFCQFGKTKVFVFKKPKGYGLKCHRVIEACCKLIGIQDLAAKVEGSTKNVKHVVKAFLIGLLQQKSYQDIADENKLHLVEYRPERLNYPNVIASPETCLSESEIKFEDKNFEEYIYGGRTLYKRPRPVPFYEKLPSWQRHLKKHLFSRNFKKVRIQLMAEHGKIDSFLVDRYPECTQYIQKSRKKEQSEAEATN